MNLNIESLLSDLNESNRTFTSHLRKDLHWYDMREYYSCIREELKQIYSLDKGEFTKYYAMVRGRN